MTNEPNSPGPFGRLSASTVDVLRALSFFTIVVVTAVVLTTTFIAVADPIVAASQAIPASPASQAVDMDAGDAGVP